MKIKKLCVIALLLFVLTIGAVSAQDASQADQAIASDSDSSISQSVMKQ